MGQAAVRKRAVSDHSLRDSVGAADRDGGYTGDDSDRVLARRAQRMAVCRGRQRDGHVMLEEAVCAVCDWRGSV